MFCPKCGKADQTAETYCRQCGIYLPDPFASAKRETPVEEHLDANSFLSISTAVVSISYAIALFVVFGGQDGTHWLIYGVQGFLTAVTAWQIQVYIRNRALRKRINKLRSLRGETDAKAAAVAPPAELSQLPAAGLRDVVPPSVTERTTRQLSGRSPNAEH